MVDELAWRVQTLAAMTEEARGIGLGVEVEEKSTIDHRQAAMEHVETILELTLTKKRKKMREEEKERRVEEEEKGKEEREEKDWKKWSII